MAEKLKDYIKSRKSDPETWLPEKLGAPAKKRSRPATHIGKYTHPDANINASIQANLIHGPKGYLSSGNFATTLKDYAGSAEVIPFSKTVEAEMEDGRTVREHLQSESEALKSLCKTDNETFYAWQKAWEKQQEQSMKSEVTDRRLRQIYFPLGDGQYRIMTLLPCSILIWELKKRINDRVWQHETTETNKEKKNIPKCFFNQCYVKYGGAHPKNISFLNNENRGNAIKLTCMPPTLNRGYTLPTRNFFNLIRPNRSRRPTDGQTHLGQLFEALYQTLAFNPNTDWARRKKRGIICAIIEYGVILPAENIRENAPAGWSADDKYAALPQEQKAWLDPERGKDPVTQQDGRDWQEAVCRSIATFITTNLEKMMKYDPAKKSVPMDDAFVNEISDLAREYLNG
jgi:CRISPR-associated protein Csy1